MNEKLIKKICEIYNKWQDEYEMEYQKRVPLTYLPKIIIYEDGQCDTEFEISSEGFELHGFLINREYGFFEALVNMKKILDPSEYLNKSVHLAERLRAEFANAQDKDAWMDEII